eukprot:801357-Rhodomonas_salina.2
MESSLSPSFSRTEKSAYGDSESKALRLNEPFRLSSESVVHVTLTSLSLDSQALPSTGDHDCTSMAKLQGKQEVTLEATEEKKEDTEEEEGAEENLEVDENWKRLGRRYSDRTIKAKALQYGVEERYVEDFEKMNKLITIESIAEIAEIRLSQQGKSSRLSSLQASESQNRGQ